MNIKGPIGTGKVRVVAFTGVAAAILAGMYLFFFAGPRDHVAREGESRSADRTRTEPEDLLIVSRVRNLTEKERILQELKKEWRAVGTVDSSGARTEVRNELAARSAALLGFSNEIIQLQKYIDEHRISVGSSTLGRRLIERFAGKVGADLIVEFMKGDRTWDPTKIHWVEIAAVGLSSEDFEGFYSDLTAIDKRYSHRAAVARWRELAKRQPEAAMEATLKELSIQPYEWMVSSGHANKMVYEMVYVLPQNTDFGKVKRMMDDFDPEQKLISYAHGILYEKWAKQSPADAINYIIENSDRENLMMIPSIAQYGIRIKDPAAAMEWIDQFPPDFRDYGYQGAVSTFAYAAEPWEDSNSSKQLFDHARSFAEKIVNPELREQAFIRIEELESQTEEPGAR